MIMIPHLLLEYGITMTVLPIRIRLRFYDKNAVAPSWSFPVGKQSRSLCGNKWELVVVKDSKVQSRVAY